MMRTVARVNRSALSGTRTRSEEHTSELQSHSDLRSFPTRRSSDLSPSSTASTVFRKAACGAVGTTRRHDGHAGANLPMAYRLQRTDLGHQPAANDDENRSEGQSKRPIGYTDQIGRAHV